MEHLKEVKVVDGEEKVAIGNCTDEVNTFKLRGETVQQVKYESIINGPDESTGEDNIFKLATVSSGKLIKEVKYEPNISQSEESKKWYSISDHKLHKKLVDKKLNISPVVVLHDYRKMPLKPVTVSNIPPPNCIVCGFSAVSWDDLRIHRITHNPERPFPCSYCEYSAKRNSDLKDHLQSHVEGYPYKCSLCDYKCKRKKVCNNHILRHTQEPFTCDICKKNFIFKGSLIHHIKYIHGEVKPVKCNICNFYTFRKSTLRVHMNTVHSTERRFKCSLCDYTSTRKNYITRHFMRHSGQKLYSCSLCKFSTTNSGSLNLHMRIHTGERPFQCILCDKAFKMKNTLKDHMDTHKPKKHQCPDCYYCATSEKNLKRHRKTCGIKVFQFRCPVCNYKGKTKYVLDRHMRYHNSEMLKCYLCDYSTPSKVCLKSHLNTHMDYRPLHCYACEYRGRSKSHLSVHIKQYHSNMDSHSRKRIKRETSQNDLFTCITCGFKAGSYGFYRNHMKKHVK